MISHVFGKVVEKFEPSVIVDVNGVGYEVQVPLNDYEKTQLEEDVKFYTYHYVREQSHELFGFSSLTAKKLFELLISVQGVGPKAALSIMSIGETEIVRSAIANSDSVFISKANGVGRKTAERVVVDLSDKVGLALNYNTKDRSVIANLPRSDDAMEALIALGYNLKDASKALENVPKDLPTSERVTKALRSGV